MNRAHSSFFPRPGRHIPQAQTLKPDLRTYLGKEVAIHIDRPLGSTHPRWPDIHYPVNYGYVPGTLSGDGHPVDAYLLGVHEPVQAARGVVIGVIIRADDVEDKLVVAPEGQRCSPSEISALVEFQEKYFDTSLVLWEADE